MSNENKKIRSDVLNKESKGTYSRIYIDIKTGKVTIGELRKLK